MQLSTLNIDEELERAVRDAETAVVRLEQQSLSERFYFFVKAAWKLVEPDKDFVPNWHIEALCDALQEAYYARKLNRKTMRRIVINVPPGTAKSLIVNVLFPCWVWTLHAGSRFLLASYGAHLTMRDNLRARQIIESKWYRDRWPVALAEDQNAKGRYNTTAGGWRIATSVDGVGTGEHPDFILIDDPTSALEAESDTVRQVANDWFDRTMSTRLGRNPTIIIIMQRLHKDDLSGHVLKRPGWDHVRWPMRFEKCTCPKLDPMPDDQLCPLHKADPEWIPDPRDPRTEHGELLFPELFPESKVQELELNLGAYGAAGQLQQRPSPIGGHLFQRQWFKFVDVAPALMREARGWDTASTEGGGDATASVKCGEEFDYVIVPAAGVSRTAQRKLQSMGRFYFMSPISEHFGPSKVDDLIRATAKLDGKDCAQREEKEGGSAGKAVIEARTKALKGYNYAGVQISGSKATRAKPLRAQCEAGNVYLVGSPKQWEPFIKELTEFPTGDHDDYVDAASSAFNSVLLEEPPRKATLVWGSGNPLG